MVKKQSSRGIVSLFQADPLLTPSFRSRLTISTLADSFSASSPDLIDSHKTSQLRPMHDNNWTTNLQPKYPLIQVIVPWPICHASESEYNDRMRHNVTHLSRLVIALLITKYQMQRDLRANCVTMSLSNDWKTYNAI